MKYIIGRKKITLRLLFGALIVLVLYAGIVYQQGSVEDISTSQMTMLDIGQGDSFFLQGKDRGTILIDGGRGSAILGELLKVYPTTKPISVIIVTHPDADHAEGLIPVIERYDVGVVLVSGAYADTEGAKRLYDVIGRKKIPLLLGRTGLQITLSDTEKKTILFPDRDVRSWETNASSIVSRFDAGGASVLFTGDAPVSVEKYLVNNYKKYLDVDVLKLGHHGSRTSTSEAFMRAASPELALISAGRNNSYGHPHKEVTDILTRLNVPWVSTQNTGTVTFFAEGEKWVRE